MGHKASINEIDYGIERIPQEIPNENIMIAVQRPGMLGI
jgi:hypothetical protein